MILGRNARSWLKKPNDLHKEKYQTGKKTGTDIIRADLFTQIEKGDQRSPQLYFVNEFF